MEPQLGAGFGALVDNETREWRRRVALLVLCPLFIFALVLVCSLQVLRYIDVLPNQS